MTRTSGQLDQQQALLVKRLRQADGAAVSFDELRAAGIENPALLCYELAAVGLPVTRTCAAGEGMPALSVRLESRREPGDSHVDSSPAPGERLDTTGCLPARVPGTPATHAARIGGWLASARAACERFTRRAWRAARRLDPPPLLWMPVLALTLAAIIAIMPGSGARGRAPRASADHARAPGRAHRRPASRPRPVGGVAAPTTVVRPAVAAPLAGGPAAPASGSRASADGLDAEGHRLLEQGSYASAVVDLLGAIRFSRQSLAGCIEPASEACLTFAYALYDLGRALRLEGRTAEAIAVLTERLRIDDQRATVQRELERARGARA